jgi:mono/diheme cytochrome c family protein
VEGYEELEKVGPSLRRVSAKVDPQWMVDWIQDPFAFRPRTKMPDFGFSADQAKAVAAYLWASSKADGEGWLATHPDPGGITPADGQVVARGKELFDSVGCRACHAIEDGEVATPLGAEKDYAPNLRRVGEKTTARFIYWWIKDPRGYNPDTRMPSLRLADDEARAITAYLISLSPAEAKEEALPAGDLERPELVEAGKSLVRKYGCYGCHAINGMDAESRIGVELSTFADKPLEELFFGGQTDIPRTWNDWTFHKLKSPRVYATEHVEQLMPNFHLADEDALALRVWLLSRTGSQPPPNYQSPGYADRQRTIQRGRRIVQRYNCMGCHQIDGTGGYVRRLYKENPEAAPPILNQEGAKVQPEWFFGFLQDPARQPLRFWLKIRMPTFALSDDETTAIVDYFTATADLKDPYFFWEDKLDSTPELLQVGKKLMSDEYFSCWSCHVRGSETPAGPQEQWAPKLAYARERLNPSWILQWIKDPPALMPGTKMPSFYPGGPPDIFDGNEDRQILAIRDYIMSIGGTQGAPPAAAQPPPQSASGEAAAAGRVAATGGADAG